MTSADGSFTQPSNLANNVWRDSHSSDASKIKSTFSTRDSNVVMCDEVSMTAVAPPSIPSKLSCTRRSRRLGVNTSSMLQKNACKIHFANNFVKIHFTTCCLKLHLQPWPVGPAYGPSRIQLVAKMNTNRNYYDMQLEGHPLAPPDVEVSDREINRSLFSC